ncbi:uncharacterized protein E0L32_003243 [Thyridium curvatum]|uniref:tRNA wybutosine-synthesizing protein 2 n=1 Tax=Thyridium curvatum TaxID=1093900 RepID=A0A507B1Y6_9PEZI|nr:uncharacterized protein E0L32_003243 [Thyridium curvatum]TPX17125.1 hypothetical protein E0L32_003243 [Thyridium curvatum]
MQPDRGSHRSTSKKQLNPISTAISDWAQRLSGYASEELDHDLNPLDVAGLVSSGPKRWVLYEPMVLLPSGSFTSSQWKSVFAKLGEVQRTALYREILSNVSLKTQERVTHLAVNEGIPLHVESDTKTQDQEVENILRSPSGLRMLYGDFGPTKPDAPLDEAFWVSTKQNGIYQTWAPRWTMFSRGNIKEKARLLSFHSPDESHAEEVITARRTRTKFMLKDKWAVDLYAGIGYFVFSYARLGMRVLCWELNAYSVEGLRRGALKNGWTVRVVSGEALELPTAELISGGERIVVFLESNARALGRVQELRETHTYFEALHVNCGFLPSSEPIWQPSLEIVGDGWLHLHENVGVRDIENRRKAIHEQLTQWTGADERDRRWVDVEHVELVKTFAPDVWHCVFDVYVARSRIN